MIALDTNVLVRYLTQDDPVQAPVATRLIESRCSADSPGWVSSTVLCELVWVLGGAYRYEREAIVSILEHMLRSADLQIEHEDIAWAALHAFRSGPADFADYVVLFGGRAAGAKPLFTFDELLAQHPGARLVDDGSERGPGDTDAG